MKSILMTHIVHLNSPPRLLWRHRVAVQTGTCQIAIDNADLKKKSPVECLISRRRLTGFIFNGAPLPCAASSLPSEGRLLLQPLDRVFADSLRPVGRLHACRKDLGEVLVRTSL